MKVLAIIDMQKDFIDGALGTKEAVSIVPKVAARLKRAREDGETVVFTRDTHHADYLSTQEGRKLPALLRGQVIRMVRIAREDDRFPVLPRSFQPRRDLRHDRNGLLRPQRAVNKILLHIDNGENLHKPSLLFQFSIAHTARICTEIS